MHTHPFSMDSSVYDVKKFLQKAKQRGMDAIVATEHHSYTSPAELEWYHGYAAELGLQPFRGIEISTDIGHLLAYGVKVGGWLRCSHKNELYKGSELVSILVAEGAFIAAANPCGKKGSLHRMS